MAFLDLNKAGRLNEAGNQAVDLAHLARQSSLSHNALTALILVTDPAVADRYRLFTLLQLTPSDSTSGVSSSDWKQIIPWQTLAQGTLIDPTVIADNAFQDYTTDAVNPSFPTLKRAGLTVGQYKYIIFQSDGSLYRDSSGSAGAILKLVEGFFPQTSSTEPVYTRPNSANYYRITVLASTGQTKIDRP